jgi:hypothetical protein
MPVVGDHYRAAGDESAVYRVVGAADRIALLRVTDADGRRAHTGDLRRVTEAELDAGFEPAADPDVGLSPLGSIRNLLQGMYWEVRKFL